MSFEALRWAYEQNITDSQITTAILANLCFRANDNGVCWPALRRIAKDLKTDPATVCKHVAKLKQLGLITVEKCKNGNGWLRNKYTIRGCLVSPNRVLGENQQGVRPQSTRVLGENQTNLNPNLNSNLRATKVAKRTGDRKEEPERLSSTDWHNGFEQVLRQLGGGAPGGLSFSWLVLPQWSVTGGNGRFKYG